MISKLLFLLGVLMISIEACHPNMNGNSGGSGNSGDTETTTGTSIVWEKSLRTNGEERLTKVFKMTTKTYAAGEALCKKYGGIISSVETSNELDVLGTNLNTKYALLGAKVKKNCQCPTRNTNGKCTKTANCSLKTAFDWTDTSIKTREIFDSLPNADYADILLVERVITKEGAHTAEIVSYQESDIAGFDLGVYCAKSDQKG